MASDLADGFPGPGGLVERFVIAFAVGFKREQVGTLDEDVVAILIQSVAGFGIAIGFDQELGVGKGVGLCRGQGDAQLAVVLLDVELGDVGRRVRAIVCGVGLVDGMRGLC